MLRLPSALLAATFALTLSASAQASTIFFAHLTNSQEPGNIVPTTSTGGPRPASFGIAFFELNDAMTQLTMAVTIFNIDIGGTQTADTNDNLVNAHIHVGAPPGANAGVRWGFFGAPDNDTMPKQLVVTPFVNGVGGTFTSIWDAPEGQGGVNLAASLPNIFAGLSYINFHTVQFGGGEIRGQIAQTPEPASFLLLGSGLLAAGARRYRRRQ